jgi:hypothetical protein
MENESLCPVMDKDKTKAMDIYIGNNCHSCALLGHHRLLQLEKYNIIFTDDEDAPKLDGLSGMELNAKLLANCGIFDASKERLQSLLTDGHRNCTSRCAHAATAWIG